MTTNILDFIDYETLRQYARTCCHQKHVRECDAEDIAHEAWIDCQRRGRSAVAKDNPAALARKIMFTSIQNAIHRLKAQTQPEIPLGDVLAKRPAVFSDDGTCAERAFLAADDWENPFWLRLFEAERFQIRSDASQKKVSPLAPRAVSYLLTDSRLAIAREKLKVSQPTFRRILGVLRMRFTLVFRALQAYRAFRSTFTF